MPFEGAGPIENPFDRPRETGTTSAKPAPSGPTAAIAPAINPNPRTTQGSIKCPNTLGKIQPRGAASKYSAPYSCGIFERCKRPRGRFCCFWGRNGPESVGWHFQREMDLVHA